MCADSATSTPAVFNSHPTGNTMLAGFIRQTRLLIAMGFCAFLFLWVGHWLIPGPQVDGTQALAVGPAVSLADEGATLVAVVIAVAVSTLITWPDAPHTGLLCACVGLLALAVHWGGITLLLVHRYTNLSAVYADLSMQCFFWVIFIALAEGIGYGLYRYSPRKWPLALGLPWPAPWTKSDVPLAYPFYSTVSAPVRENSPKARLQAALDQLAGLLAGIIVASLMLALLMKSGNPGQVIFACLVSFFISGLVVGMFLPRSSVLIVWLSVPLTAAFGYLLAGHGAVALPGQVPEFSPGGAAIFWGRAAPIFYVGAGLPGAIIGFYTALRANYRQALDMGLGAELDKTEPGQ